MATKISFEFSDYDFLGTVCIKNDHGLLINEYKMTIDEFIQSVIDSQHRDVVVKHGRRKILMKKRKRAIVDSGCLPSNCVRQVWTDYKNHQQIVFFDIPKTRWDMKYYDTSIEQVGYPRLLFGYQLQGNKVTEMFLFGLKDNGRIRGDTELFKFPFANVKDGKVCMGGNIYPTITDLYQLSTYHNVFFAAPSSNCYYDTLRNDSGISDLRELYTVLSEKDFPEEWLVSKKMTFDEFIKRIKKSKN